MHCEEAQPRLIELHEGSLAAALQAPVEQHVAGCEVCREDLANIRLMDALASSWEEQHPPLWNPKSVLPARASGFGKAVRDWLPVAATFLIAAVFVGTQVGTASGTSETGTPTVASIPQPTFDTQLVSNNTALNLNNRPVTHAELTEVLSDLRTEHARDRELFAQRVLAVADNRRERDFESVMRILRNGPEPTDEMQHVLAWPENDPLLAPQFDAQVQTVGNSSRR